MNCLLQAGGERRLVAAGNLWRQALALLDKTMRRPGMQILRLLLRLLLWPEPCVLQFSCGAFPV